jgi:hypothetical protein
VSSRTARAIQRNPVSKNRNKTKKKKKKKGKKEKVKIILLSIISHSGTLWLCRICQYNIEINEHPFPVRQVSSTP